MLKIIYLLGGFITAYCHATELNEAYGGWSPPCQSLRGAYEDRLYQDVEIKEGLARQQELLQLLRKERRGLSSVEWHWIRRHSEDPYLRSLMESGPKIIDYHTQDIEPKNFAQCLDSINKAAQTQREVAIFLSNNFLDETSLQSLHDCIKENPSLRKNLRFLDITYSRTSKEIAETWAQKILDLCTDIAISY